MEISAFDVMLAEQRVFDFEVDEVRTKLPLWKRPEIEVFTEHLPHKTIVLVYRGKQLVKKITSNYRTLQIIIQVPVFPFLAFLLEI